VSFSLKLLDDYTFLARQNFSVNLIDPEFARDGIGGCAAVTCEHDDTNSIVVEFRESLGRRRFHGVSYADDSDLGRRPRR